MPYPTQYGGGEGGGCGGAGGEGGGGDGGGGDGGGGDGGGGDGGGASGYQTSTITTHPSAGGDDKSLGTGADNVTEETPFEAGGTDPFGVSLGIVYDQMEPIGSFVTIDLGDEEAYVGA